MNAFLISLLLAASAPGAGSPAPAPFSGPSGMAGLSAFEGLPFRPVVGDWAEYRLRTKGEADKTVRLSIVGKETEPVEAHWIEFSVKGGGQSFILKLLSVGHPGSPSGLRKLIVKLGPGMVIDFPLPPEASEAPPAPEAKIASKSTKVKTPAGTFPARKVELSGAVSYVSDEVPIFGLVKGTSHGTDIELLAKGTGAKTQVTELPQKMAIPLLPGGWGAPTGHAPVESSSASPAPADHSEAQPGEASQGEALQSQPQP